MAEGDLDDPVDYGTTIRNNLMKRPGYRPYCPSNSCGFVRLHWDGEQFRCGCGYRTSISDDFMAGYKARWHLGAAPTGLPVADKPHHLA